MKTIGKDELENFFLSLRKEGKRIVFTNGCFDLIHPGHVALIEAASSRGDVLVIAINDDRSVRILKGKNRPLFPASERAEILLAMKWVDYVTIFSEDTPLETIKMVQPDVLVKGAEYGEHEIVGSDFVKNRGGEVVRVDMKEGYSSRTLIERIMGS